MLTRRRFIRITAATTAGALLPLAHAQTAAPAVQPAPLQGVAPVSGVDTRPLHPVPYTHLTLPTLLAVVTDRVLLS